MLYPLAVTGVAQGLFGRAASGSFVTDERGKLVGSELIGQSFRRAVYFQGRPSAAGDNGYDATSSGGSNWSPTSKKLRARALGEVKRLRAENPGTDARTAIPAELVAASASGLDPHLSPAAAAWQVPRIARARGVAEERVMALLRVRTEAPVLGFLGEARVNVLLLNLAMDRQFGAPAPPVPVR